VAALEIVIMISPFAAFFYSVFNPILLSLNQSPATRWLTAFFLPHMIVPPNEVLAGIRVAGSVLFLTGLAVFLLCAVQVYYGKLRKWGRAERGFYRIIRHPQYAALGMAAIGLAIMWPRMLTLVLLAVMFLLYYTLARDEERRMRNQYGESYSKYLDRVGMFFPRFGNRAGSEASPNSGSGAGGRVAGLFVILLVLLAGCGFALRCYTVSTLPL
jgi:protein-S-isoprenylcysteine O-methyltransferase Ste14